MKSSKFQPPTSREISNHNAGSFWRLLCLLTSALCLPAFAQYSIAGHTIDGGGTSTGGPMIGINYSITVTIGQPDADGPLPNA